MSKKDYIAIADALSVICRKANNNIHGEWEEGYLQGFTETAERVADALADDNPAFNRERWFAYLRGECGPNGGAVKR